jgi:hypothetical protein
MTEDVEREYQLWITDKRGGRLRVVWLADDRLWIFRVFDRAKFAARANCLVERSRLKLGDLEAFERVQSPIRNWGHSFIRKIFGEPNLNYRNRGIGSALLGLIIQLAKEHRMAVFVGNFGPEDLKANPDLPNWYRRRGFTILEGGDFGVGRLQMIIQQPPNEAGI